MWLKKNPPIYPEFPLGDPKYRRYAEAPAAGSSSSSAAAAAAGFSKHCGARIKEEWWHIIDTLSIAIHPVKDLTAIATNR